ncbi:MAG: endonuclease/exonuclease/phosphatase family protein [Marinilabiliaceae bacterium]|nr:endonuclease/exonuclease/phosphatase family protein [Marinilabiliaceae bacterium]
MNKLLKKIITFAFLIIINMQIFGQGWQWGNPYDVYWFTNMVHSLEWLKENPWFEPPGGGTGSGNGQFYVNIMTYNLNTKLKKPKEIIKDSGAQVVAIQEMLGTNPFKRLKKRTDMDGSFLVLDSDYNSWVYSSWGIVLLWKKPHTSGNVGTPTITHRSSSDEDGTGYIIGEFYNFCIVCVHYEASEYDKGIQTSNAIIADDIVTACKNKGKAIYIAGDFNYEPGTDVIDILTDSEFNFKVLNKHNDGDHATYEHKSLGWQHIDLILEHNTTPYPKKQLIWRGRSPSFDIDRLGWAWWCDNWWDFWKFWQSNISDHIPYLVKLRVY